SRARGVRSAVDADNAAARGAVRSGAADPDHRARWRFAEHDPQHLSIRPDRTPGVEYPVRVHRGIARRHDARRSAVRGRDAAPRGLRLRTGDRVRHARSRARCAARGAGRTSLMAAVLRSAVTATPWLGPREVAEDRRWPLLHIGGNYSAELPGHIVD